LSRAAAVTAARAAGLDPMSETGTPGAVGAVGAVGARIPDRLRTLLVMVVVAAGILAATRLLDSSPANFTKVDLASSSGVRPTVGQPAPDIAGLTVDGKAFSLAALKGQPVWLSFGASWCIDCRAEAPDVEATATKYRAAGLVVVAVFIQEDAAAVQSYASRVGFDFTLVPDPSAALASRYKILGLPTHYFISPDGTIKEIRLGGLPVSEMDAMVASILP